MDNFIARQPILDRFGHVIAYELLFRPGAENCFNGANRDMPSASVISTGMLGLADLTDGKTAFVNFSHETLVCDLAFSLPAGDVVIELLETIEADEDVIAACDRLKKAGYRIALDDYTDVESRRPLLEFADFVKIDVLNAPDREWRELPGRLSSHHVQMLAEKVETRETYHLALGSGYTCFQGYFFSVPAMMAQAEIPGYRLNYLRLLEELNHPSVNVDRIETLIKQDASIAYRLLRRVNAAGAGFRTEIRSIRHALVLLGQEHVRTCATVWSLAELGRDTPAELVVSSSLRARTAELLAPSSPCADRAADLFLFGLFSMLDAIMQQPMEQIVARLPVGAEVRDALIGKPNPMRAILDCVIAFERGAWGPFTELAKAAGVKESRVSECYTESLVWARDLFHLPGRDAGPGRLKVA